MKHSPALKLRTWEIGLNVQLDADNLATNASAKKRSNTQRAPAKAKSRLSVSSGG